MSCITYADICCLPTDQQTEILLEEIEKMICSSPLSSKTGSATIMSNLIGLYDTDDCLSLLDTLVDDQSTLEPEISPEFLQSTPALSGYTTGPVAITKDHQHATETKPFIRSFGISDSAAAKHDEQRKQITTHTTLNNNVPHSAPHSAPHTVHTSALPVSIGNDTRELRHKAKKHHKKHHRSVYSQVISDDHKGQTAPLKSSPSQTHLKQHNHPESTGYLPVPSQTNLHKPNNCEKRDYKAIAVQHAQQVLYKENKKAWQEIVEQSHSRLNQQEVSLYKTHRSKRAMIKRFLKAIDPIALFRNAFDERLTRKILQKSQDLEKHFQQADMEFEKHSFDPYAAHNHSKNTGYHRSQQSYPAESQGSSPTFFSDPGTTPLKCYLDSKQSAWRRMRTRLYILH